MSCFDHWFVKHKDRFGIGRERERERIERKKRKQDEKDERKISFNLRCIR